MEPRSDNAVELSEARRRRERVANASASDLVMVVEATPDVEPLLAALYRTEDVAVAPDGRRVVIPSFFGDHLLLVDLDIDRTTADQTPILRVSDPTVVQCESLRYPHGVGFVDDRTVLVANRGSELSAIEVPPGAMPRAVAFRTARVIIGTDDPVPVRAPSSLALHTENGLCEVLVCNNASHEVTRYVLDVDDGLHVIEREVLIGDGLAVPDGIAVSPSRRWIAVSNHDTHEVFVFAYEPEAVQPVRRVGTLRGANYPHGLRFADDDRMIL
jgi:DNA-binding beta-propeller fold protein YncE